MSPAWRRHGRSRSAVRSAPSYNMSINLVERMGAADSRKLLERSFAQFQADRSVVGLVRGIERNEEALKVCRRNSAVRTVSTSNTRRCVSGSVRASARSNVRAAKTDAEMRWSPFVHSPAVT